MATKKSKNKTQNKPVQKRNGPSTIQIVIVILSVIIVLSMIFSAIVNI